MSICRLKRHVVWAWAKNELWMRIISGSGFANASDGNGEKTKSKIDGGTLQLCRKCLKGEKTKWRGIRLHKQITARANLKNAKQFCVGSLLWMSFETRRQRLIGLFLCWGWRPERCLTAITMAHRCNSTRRKKLAAFPTSHLLQPEDNGSAQHEWQQRGLTIYKSTATSNHLFASEPSKTTQFYGEQQIGDW